MHQVARCIVTSVLFLNLLYILILSFTSEMSLQHGLRILMEDLVQRKNIMVLHK